MGEEAPQVISEQEKKIIHQIHYYFGDANLNRDKFLLEEIKKDDGWVNFEVLLTFKRLASITTDVEEIVAALKKSDDDLVVIGDDNLKIRRNPERPIPEFNEEVRKELCSRTIYAKGFPLDSEIGPILDFFSTFEQKVENLQMRKYLDKPTKAYKFKGSVFVTFKSTEDLKAFLAKEKVTYKETDLIVKSQEQYLEEKKEERNAKNAKKEKAKEAENKINLPTGAVVHFEGTTDEVTREDIRQKLDELEVDVGFIDYNKGDKVGHVRLNEEGTAKTLIEKLTDSKLTIKDVEVTFRVLTEEEDAEYLKKAVEQIKNRRHNHGRFNKGGKYNNRNNNRKRGGRGDNDGAPKAKESKVE
ncbi:SSB family protein [Megaselia abdita]